MIEEESEKKEGAQDLSPESAPDKNPPITGTDGKPAGGEPAAETQEDGEVAEESSPANERGLRFEIKKLRADRRELREQNERNEAELLRFRGQPNNPDDRQDLSQPDDVETKVLNVIRGEKIKEHRQEAFDHILSQDDVSTEKELKEIADIMSETGLDELAKTKPLSAADLALKEWRRSKDSTRKASETQRASAQDMPGGKSAGGSASAKKLWSKSEIKDMSDTDYEKNREELLAAGREGRIK